MRTEDPLALTSNTLYYVCTNENYLRGHSQNSKYNLPFETRFKIQVKTLIRSRGAENVPMHERGSGEILTDQGKFLSTIQKLKISGNFCSLGEIFINTKINKLIEMWKENIKHGKEKKEKGKSTQKGIKKTSA